MQTITLSQMAGRQLPLFSLIVPAWLVAVMSGWRGCAECWPAIVVCGGSFAGLQFLTSNFHGPTLVDVIGGLGSLVALAVFLQFWQPAEVWRFADAPRARSSKLGLAQHEIIHAWMPWVILSLMVFLWGWPSFKTFLDGGKPENRNALFGISKLSFEVPQLHNVVHAVAPVAKILPGSDAADEPVKAIYNLNWLSATGTGIFLAAILTACWLRIAPRVFMRQFVDTLWRMRLALLTIACMLGLAYVTKYSGADATLGLAFTHTGWLYPFFAPLLGWLGVAIDRLGHFFKRAVWQFAKDHGRAIKSAGGVDRRLEQHRRRDGKNDRRTEHRRSRRGHGTDRRRRGDLAIRLPA